MAEADGTIRIATSIDIKNLQSQLDQMKSDIKKTSDDSKKDIAQIGAQFAAVAASAAVLVKAVQSIGSTIDAFAQKSDRIDKVSQSLGLTRETFQELDYAFKQNGASLDNFGMGMKSLQEITTKAASGSKTAFDKLGISVKNANGTLKSQDQILTETLSAFNNMQQGVEKSSLATDIFGRSAQELMPVLKQESGSIDDLRTRAHDLGLVLSNEDVDAGVKFGDTVSDMKDAFSALAQSAFAPFLKLLTDIQKKIKDIITWFNNGSTAANVIKAAIISITAAAAGLITVFMIMPAVITAVSTAFKILTAAMASNPIGAIAVVITAVLIPAIIYLYKNWDKVCVYIQKWCADLGQDFKIVGARIKEGFVIGFNAAKIAAISLAQIIADKVLGSVANLLNVMGKMPFVGEKFKEASKAVKGFQNGLDNAMNSAKQESATVISASKAEADQAVADAKAKKKAIDETSAARLAALGAVKKEAPDEVAAQAQITDAIEKTSDTASASADLMEGLGDKQKLIAQQVTDAIEKTSDTASASADLMEGLGDKQKLIAQQVKDGYLTDEEAAQQKESAIQSVIDAMYEEGITADANGTEEQKTLASLIKQYNELKNADVQANSNLGSMFIKNLADSIEKAKSKLSDILSPVFSGLAKTPAVIKTVEVGKKIISNIGKGMTKAKTFLAKSLFGCTDETAFDNAVKNTMVSVGRFMVTSISTGISASSAVIQSAIKGIAYVCKAIWKGINWAATFDLSEVTKNVQTWFSGLYDFFANDLQNLPAFVDMFFQTLAETIKNIDSIMPEVMSNIQTIMQKVIDNIAKYGPQIIATGSKILSQLAIGLLKALPDIVKSIVSMIPYICNALVQKVPIILEALLQAQKIIEEWFVNNGPALVQYIVDTFTTLLPEIIDFIVASVNSATETFAKMLPTIISAVITVLRCVIDAIAKNLPLIIDCINEVTPMIAEAISESIPQIIGLIIEAIVKIVAAIIPKLPEIVVAIFKALIESFCGFFKGLGQYIGQAWNDLWNNFLGPFFDKIGKAIGSILLAPINGIIAVINWIIDQINKIRIDIDWLNIHVGFDIPRFSYLAKGTDNWKGGEAIVGEKGPELVDLPAGSVVHPASETASLLSGMSALRSGFMPSLAFTSSGSGNSSMSVNVSPTTVQIDGRTVGRIVYEQIDRLAANS